MGFLPSASLKTKSSFNMMVEEMQLTCWHISSRMFYISRVGACRAAATTTKVLEKDAIAGVALSSVANDIPIRDGLIKHIDTDELK